jgi:hypothetical protein
MRYAVTWALAFVAIFAVEGTSSARTTARPGRAAGQMFEHDGGVMVELAYESAPARPAMFAEMDRSGGIGRLARIYLCHISHHPRDGLRPEQHACPLFIAAAGKPAILGTTLAQPSS